MASASLSVSTQPQRGVSLVIYTGDDPLLSRFFCAEDDGATRISGASIDKQQLTSPIIPHELQAMALTLDGADITEQSKTCCHIAKEVTWLHYRELIKQTTRPLDHSPRVVIRNSFFVPCSGGEPATLEHNVWLPSHTSKNGATIRNEDKLKNICDLASRKVQHHAYWITTAIIEDTSIKSHFNLFQAGKICLIAERPYRLGEGILPILCPCPISLATYLNRDAENLRTIAAGRREEAYKIELFRAAKDSELLQTFAELGNNALVLSPLESIGNYLTTFTNPPKVNRPR